MEKANTKRRRPCGADRRRWGGGQDLPPPSSLSISRLTTTLLCGTRPH